MVSTVDSNEIQHVEASPRPKPLPVLVDTIPEELKRVLIWLVWSYEWKNGRWTKVPYNAKTCLEPYAEWWDRLGSSTNPKTWSSFDVAVEAYQKCGFDGIGISIDKTPLTGIDLDDCRDKIIARTNDDATKIIKRINSYTEISPSDTGVRILCYADKPGQRCRTGNIEVYGHGRFLTLTGHRVVGTPDRIERRQEEVVALVRDLFPAKEPTRRGQVAGVESLEDAEIVALASQARNGRKFRKLWEGDLNDHGGDNSRADLALCCMLAFYTRDEEQIDRLVRASGLYRDKWDRVDYSSRTIERALEQVTESYGGDLALLEKEAGEMVRPFDAADLGSLPKTTPALPPKDHDTEEDEAPATAKFERLAGRYVEHLRKLGQVPLFHHGRFFLYQKCRYAEEGELAEKLRAFFKATGRPQSNHVIGNVIPIVHSHGYRPLTDHPEMPFYAGHGPFPRPENVIAYQNGLLDVEGYLAGKVELIPHTPAWCSTTCLPYRFDSEARCTLWLDFLGQVFEGDEERVKLLQEWFGYCLLPTNRFEKFMWLQGPSRAGKGSTTTVLEALVGQDHFTGFSLHRLAETHGLEMLVGKHVAVCGETNLTGDRSKYRILETFNRILGNDPVEINEKYQRGFSTKLPTRFTLTSNEEISFVDHSGAWVERMLVLPYRRSFSASPDIGLKGRLCTEVEGINSWALEGYGRLVKQGRFTEPALSRDKKNEARRSNSHAFAFLQDCCRVERSCDPGNLVGVEVTNESLMMPSDTLSRAFSEWFLGQGGGECSTTSLGRQLKAILPKVQRKQRRVNGVQVWCYLGIDLKPAGMSLEDRVEVVVGQGGTRA